MAILSKILGTNSKARAKVIEKTSKPPEVTTVTSNVVKPSELVVLPVGTAVTPLKPVVVPSVITSPVQQANIVSSGAIDFTNLGETLDNILNGKQKTKVIEKGEKEDSPLIIYGIIGLIIYMLFS